VYKKPVSSTTLGKQQLGKSEDTDIFSYPSLHAMEKLKTEFFSQLSFRWRTDKNCYLVYQTVMGYELPL